MILVADEDYADLGWRRDIYLGHYRQGYSAFISCVCLDVLVSILWT